MPGRPIVSGQIPFPPTVRLLRSACSCEGAPRGPTRLRCPAIQPGNLFNETISQCSRLLDWENDRAHRSRRSTHSAVARCLRRDLVSGYGRIPAWHRRAEIRRVQIILAGNPNQGEQGIAAGVGQSSAHPVWAGNVRQGGNRPLRGDPLAGRDGRGWLSNSGCARLDRAQSLESPRSHAR